jgi:prolyl oligopeptidase
MARDGSNPVLLTGYGGFNVSLLPGFARNALYWLEKGGVYAVANLRGGSERGEEWHRAGNLGNKERVFEDFEAVISWLSTSGVSRPERIGITGGSNGGLLMGAMITRIPDKFAAAASYVGLYDMLRYDRFPPAELWVTEYGSARASAEQFRWLYGYSPYHRVQDGTRYPAVLIETADHDSRVFWGHSTKFAARLQEATRSDRPVWFFMERQVGHGAGTGLSDLVRRYDRAYGFLEDALGVGAGAR